MSSPRRRASSDHAGAPGSSGRGTTARTADRAEPPSDRAAAQPGAGESIATTRPICDASLPFASSLLFKLVRIVNLTARPFNERITKEHGLSLNEWRTMVVVAAHPRCVATNVVELAGLDKMSVSRAVAALHRDGRIEKHGDPLDHRKSRLELTPQGNRLFIELCEQARRREAQLFAGVSDAELGEFDATLGRLLQALARHSEAE